MSKVVTLQQITNSDDEETITFKRKDLEAERSNIRTTILQQKQTIMKTVAEREAEAMKRQAVEKAYKQQKEEAEKQKKMNELLKGELDSYKSKVSSSRQKCDISRDFLINEEEIKKGSEEYFNKKLKSNVDEYIKNLGLN
jgi:hypothetical protein